MKICYWKQLERHPLSAEYDDLPKAAFARMVEDIKAHGIVNGRKVTIHEDAVLDGWQFLRACVEADVKPAFHKLAKDIAPEAFVQIVNDNRRHETPDALDRHIAQRRERVAHARGEGKSLRTIAEEEKVSPQTVQNDLDSSGVQGLTPDEVKGKDGKKYKAKAEPSGLKDKPGKPRFDDDKIRNAYGILVKLFDQRKIAMGKGQMPASALTFHAQEKEKKMLTKVSAFTDRHRRVMELLGLVLDEFQLWKKDQ